MKRERVILVRGDSTKWYEQAIFIMKKNIPSNQVPVEKDMVAEAEKIINSYLMKINPTSLALQKAYNKTQPAPPAQPKKQHVYKNSMFDFYLNLLMLVCCFILVAFLCYEIFM